MTQVAAVADHDGGIAGERDGDTLRARQDAARNRCRAHASAASTSRQPLEHEGVMAGIGLGIGVGEAEADQHRQAETVGDAPPPSREPD